MDQQERQGTATLSRPGLDAGGAIGRTAFDSVTVHLNLRPGALGTPLPEVIAAVRRLLGLRLPGDDGENLAWQDFDTEARNCYERIKAIDPTHGQLRLFLAYLSSYFHELRHAHDLSLTAYGLDVLFLLLNVYQNLPALLSALAEWQAAHPEKLIPLPLRGHEALLPGLSKDTTGLLYKFAEVDDRVRHLLEESPGGDRASLSAIHLLEAVATDVQIDFLHELFGAEAVAEFTSLLLESEKAPVYLRVRNYARDVFASRGFHDEGLGAIINYLAWCALMGPAPRDGKLANHIPAAVLFEGLVEHVSRECHDRDLVACRESVRRYCKRWRLHDPEEMIAIYRTRVIEKRLESVGQIPDLPQYRQARQVFDCYRSLVKGYDVSNRRIQADPQAFFVGRLYAWNVLAGRLPAVFVRIHLREQSHDFVTRGETFLNSEERLLLDMFSTTMRLLLKGRGQTSDPVIENLVFDELTDEGWDGHRFEFDTWISSSGAAAS